MATVAVRWCIALLCSTSMHDLCVYCLLSQAERESEDDQYTHTHTVQLYKIYYSTAIIIYHIFYHIQRSTVGVVVMREAE